MERGGTLEGNYGYEDVVLVVVDYDDDDDNEDDYCFAQVSSVSVSLAPCKVSVSLAPCNFSFSGLCSA